jgi:hypothetical protein
MLMRALSLRLKYAFANEFVSSASFVAHFFNHRNNRRQWCAVRPRRHELVDVSTVFSGVATFAWSLLPAFNNLVVLLVLYFRSIAHVQHAKPASLNRLDDPTSHKYAVG